jgi:regulator of chromosome condensation (RCC1) repeat-containing protein/PASTA domain-containing protein
VANLTNVTQISAAPFVSEALTADGSAWAWGFNLSGELGIGNRVNALVPTRVVNLSGATAISAGEFSSSAITHLMFAPSLTQASGAATVGGSVTVPVQLAGFNGYTGSASLSVSGLPPGASATVTPSHLNVGQSASVVISTSSSTPTGTSNVTITASNATLGLSQSKTFPLTVNPVPMVTVPSLLSYPIDGVAGYLQSIGLTLGTATPVLELCNFYGSVISQDIAAGTVVRGGTAISVEYPDPIECM